MLMGGACARAYGLVTEEKVSHRKLQSYYKGAPDPISFAECSHYVGDQRRNTMDENDSLGFRLARWMWDARTAAPGPFANLPNELRPTSIAEGLRSARGLLSACGAQCYGAVGRAPRIAPPQPRMMQKLMGITHPCGGAIFARTIPYVTGRG